MNDFELSLVMGALGYCFGSIMYSYLLPKHFFHVDVREYGDSNPGAYNVHLCTSMPMAFMCAGLDILKGMLPAAAAFHLLGLRGWYLLLPIIGPVLGHMFPPALRFRGGKAICTAFGVMLGLMPQHLYFLLWAASILVLLPFIKDHTRLILVSLCLFIPACFLLESSPEMNLCMLCVALLVGFRHLSGLGNAE